MSTVEPVDARTWQPDLLVETNSCERSESPSLGLLESMAAGNVEAFEILYSLYGGIVYAMCKNKLRDEREANEVQSDIFLEIWQKAYRFDASRGTELSFLFAITRSRIIDCFRKTQLRKRIEQNSSFGMNMDDLPERNRLQPELEILAIEAASIIRCALDQLDTRLKSLLVASFYDALSHEQIAVRFKLPLGTVKSSIRRAISLLRSDLRQQELDKEPSRTSGIGIQPV